MRRGRSRSRSQGGDGDDVRVVVMSAGPRIMGIPAADPSADPMGRKPLLLAGMLGKLQSCCNCA